jgi:hypothetical protein
LLLTVPAFSAAGLRLAWLALFGGQGTARVLIQAVGLAAAATNLYAMARFGAALLRIFGA